MRYMIRRNYPYRDAFLSRMNEFFESDSEALPSGFPLDVVENDQEFTVKANMAGFDPEKLEITYDNNTLTIKGEVEEDNVDEKEGRYHVRERRFGSFARSISMPELIDADKISASCENGVLHVHLPKKPETQPRKIQIKSAAAEKPASKTVIDADKK
jgi:HSP20 family protein